MGQLTKTTNNMLLWACMAANYEALSFAKKMGADVPNDRGARNFAAPIGRWRAGKSTGKWAEKDMDVALELAQDAKAPVPLPPWSITGQGHELGEDEGAAGVVANSEPCFEPSLIRKRARGVAPDEYQAIITLTDMPGDYQPKLAAVPLP